MSKFTNKHANQLGSPAKAVRFYVEHDTCEHGEHETCPLCCRCPICVACATGVLGAKAMSFNAADDPVSVLNVAEFSEGERASFYQAMGFKVTEIDLESLTPEQAQVVTFALAATGAIGTTLNRIALLLDDDELDPIAKAILMAETLPPNHLRGIVLATRDLLALVTRLLVKNPDAMAFDELAHEDGVVMVLGLVAMLIQTRFNELGASMGVYGEDEADNDVPDDEDRSAFADTFGRRTQFDA